MSSKILIITGILVTISVMKCMGVPAKIRSGMAPKDLFNGPQVYLTVSPEAGYRSSQLLDRMLEIHWLNFDNQPGDMAGLYSADPTGMNSSTAKAHLLEEHSVGTRSGKKKSTVRYDRRPLDSTMNRCLDFWVAYLHQNEWRNESTVVQSSCLMIHPTWMNDIKSQIENVPLRSLMIPGTHNAGSWIYYEGLESEGPYIEYTFNQEDSIYDQLINGIRSLDVRVGHYPSTEEKYFINHDVARIRPLKTLLEDVRRFVSETNEIVLLDFHRFPVGFNNQDVHEGLVKLINEYLGQFLAPKSLTLSVTPGILWASNKNVLAFYIDDATVERHDVLWRGIEQAWGDTNSLSELESYLENAVRNDGCQGKAWAAMAQLTSTALDVILRPSFGIRGYANISNDAISEWYQRESWYSRSMIIALDFYRSTNLIETAIEVNKNHGNACL